MPLTTCFSTISSSSTTSVPGASAKARQHLHAHAMVHRHLDRARLQHLGALRGHFQHFFVGDLIELARLRNDARIGRVDAVDIGEDVAAVGLERRRQRHRRGIGAAAAQRRDAAVAGRCPGSRRPPRPGPRPCRGASSPSSIAWMRALPWTPSVRIGICQPSQERASTPRSCKRQRQQAGRDLLAGGDHDVVFARVVQAARLARPVDELVGRARPSPRPRPRPRARRRPRASPAGRRC